MVSLIRILLKPGESFLPLYYTSQLTIRFEARIGTLDDESIDFPAAYKAVATIIRSLSMTDEEIDALLSKVDVYGEPKITPRMKFDKALTQFDEEAASA
jgi:translation initiation factor 4G